MKTVRNLSVGLLSILVAGVAIAQPAPPPDFAIRPYLAACGQTEATVGWTSTAPGEFTLRYGKGDRLDRTLTVQPVERPLEYFARSTTQPGRPPASAKTDAKTLVQFQYLARLADLEAGSTYRYEVAGGGLVAGSTFATLLPPARPVTFIAYSDTQDPAIHGRLARQFAQFKPHLIVHAGDTIDDAWLPYERTDFFDPLNGLAGRVPVFPAIGNHDSGTLIARLFRQGGGRVHYSFDCGDVHFVILDSFTGKESRPRMLAWCERDLAASRARWKVVISHIPSYDAGIHGYAWGRPDLLPLYRKYGVDLVLNGHTHNYQRTLPMFTPGENDKHPITYMVIGGGGGSLHLLPTEPALAGGASEHHFVVFNASATKLSGRCFNLDGRQLDAFDIAKDAAGNLAADWVRQALPESSWAELRSLVYPCVKRILLSDDPLTGKPVRGQLQMTAGNRAMKFAFRLEDHAAAAFDMKPVAGQSPAGGTTPVELEIKLRDPAKYADGKMPLPLLRVECLFEIDGKKASVFSGWMTPATQPAR